MLDSSAFLGWISAAILFAAGAAWLKLSRGSLRRKLNSRSASDTKQVESASRLLVIAVGCCAVAAIIGIIGVMMGGI